MKQFELEEKSFSEIKIDENKKFSQPPILVGYNFSPERAREAREEGKLLTIRAETSLICNIKCRYCNSASGEAPPGEISFETIKNVTSRAINFLRDFASLRQKTSQSSPDTVYRESKKR